MRIEHLFGHMCSRVDQFLYSGCTVWGLLLDGFLEVVFVKKFPSTNASVLQDGKALMYRSREGISVHIHDHTELCYTSKYTELF